MSDPGRRSDRGEPGPRGDRFLLVREAAILALEVMRSHKLRSALLILGVAIGVTVLMAMVAILRGVSGKIESEMKSTDQDVVTVAKFDFLTEGPDEENVMARPDIMFGDPTTPIGGHIVGHHSTFRVYLKKSKGSKRIASLVDSPSMPDAECVFEVTTEGIIDAKSK